MNAVSLLPRVEAEVPGASRLIPDIILEKMGQSKDSKSELIPSI